MLTLKGKSILTAGVGVASEIEQDIDIDVARKCIIHPNNIFKLAPLNRGIHDSNSNSSNENIIDLVEAKYGVKQFVCLGGFKNIRNVYKWTPGIDINNNASDDDDTSDDPVFIELDETVFEHGTLFELEVN